MFSRKAIWLLSASMVFSCTNQNGSRTEQEEEDAGRSTEPDATPRDQDASAASEVTAVIGVEGGSLISSDGRVTVVVPELAVIEDTTFSIGITEETDDLVIGLPYVLEPSDTAFLAPVEISISYAGLVSSPDELDDLALLVRTEGQLAWDLALPSEVDTQARRITSMRWHFSDYALGRRLDALNARQRRRLINVGETLFVSPGGDDENVGRSDSPLRSLMIACWRVLEGRSRVIDDDGDDGYDYSRVRRIELEAGTYNPATDAIQQQQIPMVHRPLEKAECNVDVAGKGSTTVIRHPVRMIKAVLSGARVERAQLELLGGGAGALEVEVVGPTGLPGGCVSMVGSEFVNGQIHGCLTGIIPQLISTSEVRDSRIFDNGTGVTLPNGVLTLSGNAIVNNGIGVQVFPPGVVNLSDPGGNTISCNRVLDVDAPEGINARNNLWDHVPPRTATGSPSGNDSARELSSGGAMRAEVFCGCGNGSIEAGEECDDGNNVDDDACSNECVSAACNDGIVQQSGGELCDPSAMPTGCMPNHVCNSQCRCECQRACEQGQTLNPETCECECEDTCDQDQTQNPTTCVCSSGQACGNGRLDSGEDCDPLLTDVSCDENLLCNTDCVCECALQASACDVDQQFDAERCACVPLCGNGVFELGAESCDLSAAVDCGGAPFACTDTCTCVCNLTSQDCVAPRILDSEECACICSLQPTDCEAHEAFDPENCTCVPLCGDGVFDAERESCDASAGEDCGGAPWACSDTCECECTLDAAQCAPDAFDAAACDCIPNCGNGVLDNDEQCDPQASITSCDADFACSDECTCECILAGGCDPFPNLAVTVNAAFTNGTGSCGLPTAFNDVLELTVVDGVLTIEQPSTGDVNVGPIEQNGDFVASHPGESYSGNLNPDGSGTAVNTYGTGCLTSWDVVFVPQ